MTQSIRRLSSSSSVRFTRIISGWVQSCDRLFGLKQALGVILHLSKVLGRPSANAKARYSMERVLNTEISAVEATLMDYYVGEWIDALDELKTNIDERAVLANANAYALGRKTDELIVNALSNTYNAVGDRSEKLTKQKIMAAFELLDTLGAPDDGHRYAIVGWKQWSDLLGIEEFAEAEYVGEEILPWRGSQAKMWLGTLWMPHTGLPVENGIRTCFWYHKSAVGHACGPDVTTDITWHSDRAAHFVASSITQGAVLIDGGSVVKMYCLEN